MSYESDYATKSIWGPEGPPHAVDEGRIAGIKAKGQEMDHRSSQRHTENWLKGYEQGRVEYREVLMTRLLKGEVSKEELSKEEIDEFLGRDRKVSPGGIILP